MVTYVVPYDIDVYRGDDFGPLIFRLSEQATDTDGVSLWDDDAHTIPTLGDPVDLTGATVSAQIRKDTKLTSAVLVEMDADVMDQEDPDNVGMVRVAIPGDLTAELDAPKTYRYDVQITKADGKRRTYVNGAVNISGDVSRA